MLKPRTSVRRRPGAADTARRGAIAGALATLAIAGPPPAAAAPRTEPRLPATPHMPARPAAPRAAAPPVRPAITRLVRFDRAPFPYAGRTDDGRTPFYDVIEPATRRRGHTTWNGNLYWEKETYSDSRVLLHIPAGFDPRRPVLMVVFLHGHGATLERTVQGDLQIPRQVSESGANAVLVAPQLAYDAADSSPGKFWTDAGFARFVDEAAERLMQLWGDRRAGGALNSAKVLMVAFSGGYKPAIWALHRGATNHRIAGVVLLDALYAEEEKLADWLARQRRSAFLMSLYTESTGANQETLKGLLKARGVAIAGGVPPQLKPGTAWFLDGGPWERHGLYPLDGPPRDPVRTLLARIPGYGLPPHGGARSA